jgi:hypothetical protein
LFSNEDSVVSTEVFSHKFVLSLASDVFKREFYGSMKESGEGIKIPERGFFLGLRLRLKMAVDIISSPGLHFVDTVLSLVPQWVEMT